MVVPQVVVCGWAVEMPMPVCQVMFGCHRVTAVVVVRVMCMWWWVRLAMLWEAICGCLVASLYMVAAALCT